jgi:hypothetical protein
MKGYRFVTKNLTSQHGKVKWDIGKWNKLGNDAPLKLCQNGFHASQKPLDSLNYDFGTRWFICEARGRILKGIDKFCAREMRLVKETPPKVIKQFAIDCAYRVLPIFEKQRTNDTRPRLALEVAQNYLDKHNEANAQGLAAAEAAARAAAWDARAAGDAAWAAAGAARAARAAGDAAWAAGDAARAAAGAAAGAARAARAAAWAAERKWQNRHLSRLIRKEEQ